MSSRSYPNGPRRGRAACAAFVASGLLAAITATGCGDDNATTARADGGGSSNGSGGTLDSGDASGGGTGSNATGNGGASGNGGAGANGTTAGNGGADAALPCGPCQRISGFEACCTEDDECGADYFGRAGAGCVALNQPGRVDPTCPVSMGQTTGCCLPSGECGAFYTRTFGCVPVGVLPDFPPEPVPCGPGSTDGGSRQPEAGRDASSGSTDASPEGG